MNPLTPLREVLTTPSDEPAVMAWIASRIRFECDGRDFAMEGMARIGVDGESIAAYREATGDLRDMASRYAYDARGAA